jgi:LysM repeat protein
VYFSFGIVHAQETIVRSNITEQIDGKDFYMHEVKKGQTLYSIARAYHVNLDQLKYYNPGISDNLEIGRIIKIPAFKQEVESTLSTNADAGYIIHKVRPKATLYSLSKEFDVSVEELTAANDGFPDGLKEGAFIKIPKSRINTLPEPEIVDAQQTRPQTSKQYFEYQARDKESLYLLAIKYRVSIDSIYALNPGIDDQLRSEQIIRIPYAVENATFITHKVSDRETANRLAKKYNVDIESIKALNPYISRHLIPGQIILIPIPGLKTKTIDEFAENETPDGIVRHDTLLSQDELCEKLWDLGTYKIALILPLYLDELDATDPVRISESSKEDDQAYIKPFTFIQFYEGFMLAVDSLKKLGLNAEVFVYDLAENIEKAKQLLRNPEMKQMDLIIGPVFSSSFTIVANFAKEHHINIVNPFTTRSEVIAGNPYVLKLTPTVEQQFDQLVMYLNKNHSRSQVFIAKHNPYRDETAFSLLRSYLNDGLDTRPPPFTDLYHEIIYSRDSVYTFFHKASPDHENVVITYSDDKVFILDFMRKLNELRDTFPTTVIGIPEWKKIDFLEPEHLNNLNTQIMSDTYVDYDSPGVKQFISKYRLTYFTEPEDYAWRGYDIGWYFLSALMKFGPQFDDCITHYNRSLLQLTLDFEQEPMNGFENRHWNMLQMRNYRFYNLTSGNNPIELRIPKKGRKLLE